MKWWLLQSTGDWANYKAVSRTCVFGKSELVIRLYFKREQVRSRDLNQYKRPLGIWADGHLPVLWYGCVRTAQCPPSALDEEPVLKVTLWGQVSLRFMPSNSTAKPFCTVRISSDAAFCWRIVQQLVCFVGALPTLSIQGKLTTPVTCWSLLSHWSSALSCSSWEGAVPPEQGWAPGLCQGSYK